ncbi:MAG: hypothetical protein PHR28_04890 [candidate division Zixibacteria bacterium]|jgi:hypothetical protein|nr:hypothetical protein [candidate division Zixibacteria bacterium]
MRSRTYDYFTEIGDESKIVCNQCSDWFDKDEYETEHGPIFWSTRITCPSCGFQGVIR